MTVSLRYGASHSPRDRGRLSGKIKQDLDPQSDVKSAGNIADARLEG